MSDARRQHRTERKAAVRAQWAFATIENIRALYSITKVDDGIVDRLFGQRLDPIAAAHKYMEVTRGR